ncbi:MAG TPA: sigma-70 family RNA polymerase sigma factor [Thermomicrobiales bacterium]|jgi:RNA polymerase sigma factor (sigma-70 family)|nr:hypothetical protein [Chloroflexota bacterium]HBY45739.1 hypothetical protein [Chloroflexota bacterium]HQZ90593.1 sigma-70 family RNA polymerase sigma factor [Thermomicrobiales bacterium]HRA31985.1 sigma-70 family RNA polymerase sigma factor [Thermomicrobiales bacterium]
MNSNERSTPDPSDWLTALIARSLGDVEMTPDLDLALSRYALLARDDLAIRDRLLTMLSWKVARFCARYRRRAIDPWEIDDVQQEAFLAFVDVLAGWQPLTSQDGPAGFGYYFLRVFPMRLAGRVRALLREGAIVAPQDGAPHDPLDSIDIEDIVLANQVIVEICGYLNSRDQAIFQLSVRDGHGPSRIAELIGVNRRTIHRHWPAIVSIARERLRDAS